MSQPKRDRKSRQLPRVHPAAAAIDIGATMHVAAVSPDRDQEPVRTFTDNASSPWHGSQRRMT